MSAAQDLNKTNFDTTIEKGVTLVDFWAEWCGPCRMMSPLLDEIANEYSGKITVGKINVDHEGDLAMKFDVSSIPTLIVFKDGAIHKRFIGVTKKEDLTKALSAAGA